jgi:hypothetical protein
MAKIGIHPDSKTTSFTFDNGYTLSIGVGDHHYSSNYHIVYGDNDRLEATSVEILISGPNGNVETLDGDQIVAWVDVDILVEIIPLVKMAKHDADITTIYKILFK